MAPVSAGRPAIVIDDFGYRPHTENQVLAMPSTIPIAVLLNALYACEMVIKAYNSGREVLVRLPVVPLSRQLLERDMLCPETGGEEVKRIIRDAADKVLDVIGLSSRMGSAMTSSLPGMQKMVQALEHYGLYFLNSMAIGNSQVIRVASETSARVIRREVFLDNTQNEADIRRQSNRAVELTRRSGSIVVIGHPHPSTTRVLQQMLYSPPADIALVHPSSLFSEPQADTSRPNLTSPENGTPDTPRDPFRKMRLCEPEQPLKPVYISRFLGVLGESITQSMLARYIRLQWQD